MSRSHRWWRRTQITAAAGLLCATLPVAAHAQQVTKSQDKNNDFSTTVFSDCTQENVAINGKSQTRIDQSSAGANKSKFRFRQHDEGTGLGMVSSSNYQYQDINENEAITTAQAFTIAFVQREHLIRQGKSKPPMPGDDMFINVRSKFTFDNNGNVTKSQSRDSGVQCK